MKHFLLSAALLATTGLSAQTTALNFTANDCDGMPHDLFSELEAGNAVILELVMMGCQPCINAGNSIKNNVLPNVSDPSRLKFYSIGYTNSISCTQMNNWKTANGFTHTVFGGMSAQTTYYGGMGMPTVVVVGGGSAHGVYYNVMSHNDSHNPAIIAAVNNALLDAAGVEENAARQVVLGPNPVTSTLNLNGTYVLAKVTDLQGRVVLNTAIVGTTLHVDGLPAGVYNVELTAADKTRASGRFVKH